MGCASSKNIRKHADEETGILPAFKTSPGSKTFYTDIEDYHRHLLALTSSSGISDATADSQKTAATGQKDEKNAAAHMDSLNDMFDKLATLESAELGPKPWNEVSSMLATLKSVPKKDNSRPPQGWKVCPTDLCLSQNPETIDVGEIMKGLDDETPRVSSASQNADSPAPHPRPSLPTKAFTPRQHIAKFDAAIPIHTIDEVDARLGVSKDSGVGQISKDSIKKGAAKSQTHGFGRRGISSLDGMEKENDKPLGCTVPGRDVVTSNTTLRSPFVNPPVTSKNSCPPRVSPVLAKESNANRRDTVEDICFSKDVSIESSTGITSTAVIKRSTSGGKVKFTCNLENQETLVTGTLTSGQTALTPEGSLSERSLVDPGSLATETGDSYFDPELLTSYEKALENQSEQDWNAIQFYDDQLHQKVASSYSADATKKEIGTSPEERAVERDSGEVSNLTSQTLTITMEKKRRNPFKNYEEKCPPGGEKTVVLYMTTLRGIRKTFEDCNNVREILQSFGLSIDLRDVSMHLEFRNELMELMGRVLSVPRLFIKGRYIGGLEEVAKLHENGKLSELVEGLPKERTEGNCDGCGGMRFIPCLECSGSCKIVNRGKVGRCPHCNENGLIQCPICS